MSDQGSVQDVKVGPGRPRPARSKLTAGLKMHEDAVILFDRFHQTGKSLRAREKAGRLALVGIGVEPGLSDVFARYAADHLFSEIDELGTVTDPTSPTTLRRPSRSGPPSRSV